MVKTEGLPEKPISTIEFVVDIRDSFTGHCMEPTTKQACLL